MNQNKIRIKFVKNWDVEEIITLYKAGGWWDTSTDKSIIKPLINGSYAFAVVVDQISGKTIGMGRLLSDGVSDAYIQDLVVLPKYRKQGIGRILVHTLIEYCISKGIRWIGLISEPGNNRFFSQIGLKPMKGHTPMIYSPREKQ
jgi:ribosomal protein S18 acetylase RimI-like enzyme